jgi:molybdate transport system ATP-binding protein
MKQRLSIMLHAAGVRRGKRWVLENVNLQFRPGERWALTGENGSGKTHLLKLLSGDLWPTPTGRERRVFRLGATRIDEAQAKSLVSYLGAERQDKYVRHDWNFTVREILTAGVQGTDIVLEPPTRAQRAQVTQQLARCRLTSLASRRFLTLSYGQKRLALLARCLIARPHWLLLDECYNGLDERFRKRVDAILAGARRRGQSWVASAHRLQDIPAGTTLMVRLQSGHVVTKGALRASTAGLEPESAALAPAVTRRRPVRHGSPPALPMAGGRRASAAGRPCAPQRTPLIRVREADLFVDFHPVLRGIDWVLHHGEHWVVSGANGAGKSSFLRLLYGDLAPAHGGSIERAGLPRGTPIEEWKKIAGFVSPELQSEYSIDVSVRDLVVSGRYASIGLNDAPQELDLRIAAHWLGYFGLDQYAQHRPRELSYGQMRRALLARAMAGAPRLLLLDEPFTGLDPRQRALQRELLEGLMARGVTLVMAVHHAEDLPAGITHALRLHKRRAYASSLRIANPVDGRRGADAA